MCSEKKHKLLETQSCTLGKILDSVAFSILFPIFVMMMSTPDVDMGYLNANSDLLHLSKWMWRNIYLLCEQHSSWLGWGDTLNILLPELEFMHSLARSLTYEIPLCCVLCLVAQSCPTLYNPMDCSPLSMGVLQARRLEWVFIPSSRGSSQPGDGTQVSRIAGRFFESTCSGFLKVWLQLHS